MRPSENSFTPDLYGDTEGEPAQSRNSMLQAVEDTPNYEEEDSDSDNDSDSDATPTPRRKKRRAPKRD